MNEQQLKDRLSGLVGDQPPMRQGSADDLRVGRSRLRRRRGTVVVGASALAVAAVVVAVQAPWLHGATSGRSSTLPAASGGDDPSATVIERCTRTDNGALDAKTFGAGARILTMETSAGGDVNAVVLSADGRTWGSCWLSGSSTSEFNGYASAYPMTEGRPAGTAGETNGMSYGRGQFWYVDRFRPEVTAVTVRVEGKVLRAKAVDGFVAFMRDVPGLTMDSTPQFDVTLFGADGRELAGKDTARGDDTLPAAWRSWVPGEELPDGGAGR